MGIFGSRHPGNFERYGEGRASPAMRATIARENRLKKPEAFEGYVPPVKPAPPDADLLNAALRTAKGRGPRT